MTWVSVKGFVKQMGKLFSAEGPLSSFLNKMTDLMLLNLLTCVFCIPIITAGAAFTALHYMMLKMVRNEEGYIIRGFWKSFKQNFKQATIIWLLILLFICIFIGDWYIIHYTTLEFSKIFSIIMAAIGFLLLIILLYIFPVLARFENTIFNTLKNAALIAFISFPRAVLMLIIYLIPAALTLLLPEALPLVALLGVSLPAYAAAMLYSGVLKKFEPQTGDEEETAAEAEDVDNIYNKSE